MLEVWSTILALYTSCAALAGTLFILPWCNRRPDPYPSLLRYLLTMWLPWPYTLVRIFRERYIRLRDEWRSAATLEAQKQYEESLTYWQHLTTTGSPAEQALAQQVLLLHAKDFGEGGDDRPAATTLEGRPKPTRAAFRDYPLRGEAPVCCTCGHLRPFHSSVRPDDLPEDACRLCHCPAFEERR